MFLFALRLIFSPTACHLGWKQLPQGHQGFSLVPRKSCQGHTDGPPGQRTKTWQVFSLLLIQAGFPLKGSFTTFLYTNNQTFFFFMISSELGLTHLIWGLAKVTVSFSFLWLAWEVISGSIWGYQPALQYIWREDKHSLTSVFSNFLPIQTPRSPSGSGRVLPSLLESQCAPWINPPY